MSIKANFSPFFISLWSRLSLGLKLIIIYVVAFFAWVIQYLLINVRYARHTRVRQRAFCYVNQGKTIVDCQHVLPYNALFIPAIRKNCVLKWQMHVELLRADDKGTHFTKGIFTPFFIAKYFLQLFFIVYIRTISDETRLVCGLFE